MITLVPYRPGLNLWRARAVRVVLDHLRPLSPMLVGDGLEAGPFAKCSAINMNVRPDRPAEVVVLNDADSLVPWPQMDEMIRLAGQGRGLVVGYTDYLRLTQQATFTVLEKHCRGVAPDYTTADLEWAQNGAPSIGVCAIRTDRLLKAGGMDESFVGWGPEDIDFAERCLATVGVERVPGPLYHLWHDERRPDDSPASSDPRQVERNRAYYVAKHAGVPA